MPSGDHHCSCILDDLKAGTREIHQRLEQTLQIFGSAFGVADYVLILERFYGFWEPLEARLCQVTKLHDPLLALPSRLKAHLLEGDLRVLGVDPGVVPRCAHFPRVDTLSRSLGCLYVLEGSTLGSQIISRRLREQLQLDQGCGASFFNAYGGSVGKRWSEFRSFLISRAGPGSTGEILAAAEETFEALYDWLAPLDRIHLQRAE